jgi:hypothetical protein
MCPCSGKNLGQNAGIPHARRMDQAELNLARPAVEVQDSVPDKHDCHGINVCVPHMLKFSSTYSI